MNKKLYYQTKEKIEMSNLHFFGQPPEVLLSYYLSGRIHWFFPKSTLYINGFSSSEQP